MIMSLQSKNRLRLIVPPLNSKVNKVLKTCKRCRQHKTKCDAYRTNPFPCSHCVKRNLNCTLEIINKPTGRVKTVDMVEKLSCEVDELKYVLSRLLERKSKLVDTLIMRGKQVQAQAQAQAQAQVQAQNRRLRRVNETEDLVERSPTPLVSEIETCIESPLESPLQDIGCETLLVQPPTTQASLSKFVLSANTKIAPVLLSHKQAQLYFTNYERHFNSYLPIFPDEFFRSTNLVEFHTENELTFWCIIITSLLNQQDQAETYKNLTEHIKSLVVAKCWLQTPRSVYIISSLLILTTWPLPNHKTQISDNLCIKYISLMKSLSLQFGLHKLEFISEFSHKTKLNVTREVNLNNRIRERIYKFVNVNSNYWLIHLGLSNNNHNGFTQDYIINKASNIDLFDSGVSSTDQYINSLLKISIIQSKLNENMSNLIGDRLTEDGLPLLPNQINTSKMINFNMFEIILNDLNKMLAEKDYDSAEMEKLIQVSIAYSKLQLFVYSLSKSDISVVEYKNYVIKLINCCLSIVELMESEEEYLKLPIFYKFPVELASLTLLRVFKSPILSSVSQYQLVKNAFGKLFDKIFQHDSWHFMNFKLLKIIEKFDKLENEFIIAKQMDQAETLQNSFFLVTRMKNYLVSSLQYELIWLIYEQEKNNVENFSEKVDTSLPLDFIIDKDLQKYIKSNESILTIL